MKVAYNFNSIYFTYNDLAGDIRQGHLEIPFYRGAMGVRAASRFKNRSL